MINENKFNDLFSKSIKKYNKYKCDSPNNTIKNIKRILTNIGINPKVLLKEICPDLWVSILIHSSFNIQLSMGKGVTKSLALASGYAEAIERLQAHPLTIFPGGPLKKREKYISITDNRHYPKKVNQFSNNLVFKYDIELSKPHYYNFIDLRDGNKKWVNLDILNYVGTNGTAAGNTIEEASVQALCEIFERYVTKRIWFGPFFKAGTIKKNFKDNFIKNQIRFLNEMDIEVIIKDLSTELKLPVVGIILLDILNNEVLSIRIASHPSQEKAIIRCLTEALQGINIIQLYKRNENIDKIYSYFEKHSDGKKEIIWNISITYGFFPHRSFEENAMLSSLLSNDKKVDTLNYEDVDCKKEFKTLLQLIPEKYSYLLFKNFNFLGFPTVQVIVPNFSFIYNNKIIKKLYGNINIFDWFQKNNFLNRENYANLINNSSTYVYSKLLLEFPESFINFKKSISSNLNGKVSIADFLGLKMKKEHPLNKISIDSFVLWLNIYFNLNKNTLKLLELHRLFLDDKWNSIIEYALLDYYMCKTSNNENSKFNDLYSHFTIKEIKKMFDKDYLENKIENMIPSCLDCKKCKHKKTCYFYTKGENILKNLMIKRKSLIN